jgi:hypothetical protein
MTTKSATVQKRGGHQPDDTGQAPPTTPPPSPVKKTAQPKAVPQTEMSVSYSIGTKVNIGNYESVDVHFSRSEKYDTTGLTKAAVDALWNVRYQELHDELGDLVLAEKAEIMGTDQQED